MHGASQRRGLSYHDGCDGVVLLCMRSCQQHRDEMIKLWLFKESLLCGCYCCWCDSPFIWFFLFFYYNLLYALQHHMKNIYKVICFKLKYFLFHIFFFFFDLFWFVLSLKVFNFLVNMFFGCGVYFNSIRFSHCDLIFVFFFVYYAFDHKFLTRKQMQLRFFHQPLMNCFNLKILGFLFCGLEIFNLIWFLFKLKKKHLGGEIYDFFVLLNYTL